MNILFSLLIILALGFIGSRLSFFKLRVPLASLFLSGDEYILLGVVIGPSVLGLIDSSMLIQLNPLMSLLLGWIGFLYGLQFEWNKIKRVPYQYFFLALFTSVSVFLLTLGVFFYVFVFLLAFQPDSKFYIALLTLSIVASVSSPTSVALFVRDLRIKDKNFQLLQYISSTDGVFGICAFGLVFAYFHFTVFSSAALMSSLEWIVISIVLGSGFAFLFRYLIIRSQNLLEIEILTIGMLIFSGGLCAYLGISPLFTNFIFGISIANFQMLNKSKVFRVISRFEQPFYIALLIMAGCLWVPDLSFTVLFICLFYIYLRIFAKVFSFMLCIRVTKMNAEFSQWGGFGLVAQGGLAVAMIMNFQQMHQSQWTQLVINVGIFSIMLNQIISGFFIKRFSKNI